MRRDARSRGLVAALALALAIAAAGAGAGPAADAAPLPQAQRVVVTTPSTGLFEMPLIVALRRGFFTEEGLEVSRVQMAPPVSVAAVLSGEGDYTLSSGSVAVAIATSNAPLKIILGMATRALHALVTNDPAVQSVNDLRGRSVAASTLTDSSAAFVRFALRARGLEAQSDVALQALGQSPNRLAAMQSGQVAAVILDLAHALEAQRGGARILLGPRELPDLPTSGLSLTEARLREQAPQAERMVRALLRGVRAFRDDQADSVQALIDHLGLAREVAEATWDVGRESFDPSGVISESGLRLLLESAELASGQPAQVGPEQLADFTIVRRVAAQLGP